MTRGDRSSRRRVLAAVGGGTALVLAGCIGGGGGGDPRYEDGEIPENVSGDNRTTRETNVAYAAAQQTPSDTVTRLDNLAIVEHRFVYEDGYLGSTVQGTVENTGTDRVEVAEVRVRVYDDAGTHLGRYLASTGDLDGGETWAFQVIVLEPPGSLADYDISVLGTPS
ncbi:FxLYD domain-containing protein [Natrialbaceae archaeon GCM10025810]|uniref:FxLYD domain-containing protein n=1 Tax=Halovalidus salilacus TaxID=3075124 RepID=UPI0036136635